LTLIWAKISEGARGTTPVRPDELIAKARSSLQSAIENPIIGQPERPTRVRVPTEELAEELRGGFPDIEFVCAPVPELVEILQIINHLTASSETTGLASLASFLTEQLMLGFFQAIAALFRAAPWKYVISEQAFFYITIKKLNIRCGVVTLPGRRDKERGFSLYPDAQAFWDCTVSLPATPDDSLPNTLDHFTLEFIEADKVSREFRKTIEEKGWEIAAANAYPRLAVINDTHFLPPTQETVLLSEVIARTLTLAIERIKNLPKGTERFEDCTQTFTVPSCVGEVEVSLVRFSFEPSLDDPSSPTLMSIMASVCRRDGFNDDTFRTMLENELMIAFEQSPEAADLDDIHACQIVMDLAADRFNHTISTLGPNHLHELIFEFIPAYSLLDESEAKWFIDVIRALYKFLKRRYGLKQADDCLRVLEGDAAQKLRNALSDCRVVKMLKVIRTAGTYAGFDLDTKEGTEAWRQALQDGPMPSFFQQLASSSAQGSSQKTPDKSKAKRKAARKARKKNR